MDQKYLGTNREHNYRAIIKEYHINNGENHNNKSF